jgi:hypothetical protein
LGIAFSQWFFFFFFFLGSRFPKCRPFGVSNVVHSIPSSSVSISNE